ncbi:MAG: penicillin-binding transpeptidase domain-containing protein [Candidatus Dadabacteria bacterium]|nr:penicillin-binding transpeptidase domain-containing protein [Candidatus Dadabacteria bacterium]MDE0477449.1 penicillin-binding transpeptidase domain-containing protein [Candidatus Dadabacteria bacterium]
MRDSEKQKRKFYIASVFITGLFVLLGYRSFELQVLQSEKFSAGAKKQHSRVYRMPPVRGTLFDRNKKPLATSVWATSIYLNPKEVKNPDKLARTISKPLGLSRNKLISLTRSDKPFVWIKRGEDPVTAKKIEAMGLSGVGFAEEPKRIYPNGSLLGQTIGFTNIDLKGVEGLEYGFEKMLAGKPATVRIRTDGRGNSISDVLLNAKEQSTKGSDVLLTVDSNIQHMTETALEKGIKEMKADRGAALLMNPQTGEILSMASYPFFNPNRFGEFSQKTRKNLPVWMSFEPGSTLKVFLAATLLEEKMGDENTEYDCENGKKRIGPKVIKDVHGHGILTVSETITYSSNICAWKMGETLGKKKLHDSLRNFGFGETVGVDLPGEATGRMQSLRDWGDIELATISFGQGISVTAIQLATALSSIGNGGYLMKPYIVKKIVSPEGKVLMERSPESVKRVISYDTASKVTRILEQVVENGTGKNASIPGYRVAGKTGTAQMPNPQTGTYYENRYLSSFIGFAPADDPRLALVVIVENPREHNYGGVVAAPIFKSITEKVLFYMQIPPDKEKLEKMVMPDMVNKSARAVMKWAEKEEVSVRFIGNGYVVSQHPPSGKKIRRGTDCTFILKQNI